jgi:diketogulonate reductase-like aldo/keto reductase
MILNETFTLNNGVKIPKIGLGTWMIEGTAATQAVRDAIALGYRHIDTAWGYGNEKEVDEGVRLSGIHREEVFVTTKIHAFFKTAVEAKKGIEESLERLSLEYIDLLLIHAPQPWTEFRDDKHYFEENLEVWRIMEEYYHAGKVRALRVSNFEEDDLRNLLENADIKPGVNQVLCHISNTSHGIIEYSKKNDVLVEAYSPIGHGAVLKNETIQDFSKKYSITPAQLCIQYCLQLGLLPLPKTSNIEHMKTNANISCEISEEDMATLEKLPTIKNYGEGSEFPVFGGKINADGTLTKRDFVKRV